MSRFTAVLILAVSLVMPMAPETLQEDTLWPSDPHSGPWLDPDG